MDISQPHEFQVFRFSVFLVCARHLDAFWMGSVSAGVDAVKRRLQNVIKDEDVLCKKKEDARQKLKNLTARRKRRWERAFQIYCKTVPDALPAIQFLRLSSNCTYFPESERQLQALLEEKFLSCNIDVLAEASHMEVRTGTRKTVWKNSSEALIEALTVNWIQQTNTEQARAPQSQEVLSAMRRIPSLAPCADSPSAWLPITEQHKSVLRRFKQRWRLRRGTLGTDPGLSLHEKRTKALAWNMFAMQLLPATFGRDGLIWPMHESWSQGKLTWCLREILERVAPHAGGPGHSKTSQHPLPREMPP